jgi:hypothetical protein
VSDLIPQPYELALLALAVFRLTRLVGWDTITTKVREWVTGYDDDGAPVDVILDRDRGWRPYANALIRCPWCVGFWLSLIAYGSWLATSTGTLVAASPLAISALVGLVAKNLDP